MRRGGDGEAKEHVLIGVGLVELGEDEPPAVGIQLHGNRGRQLVDHILKLACLTRKVKRGRISTYLGRTCQFFCKFDVKLM